MFLETTDIRWNSRVQSDYFRLGLNCDPRYASARPGQFVTLHLPDQKSPLLRRPFSIHRLLEDVSGFHGIEILYKVVGEFTRKLSKKKNRGIHQSVGTAWKRFFSSFQSPADLPGCRRRRGRTSLFFNDGSEEKRFFLEDEPSVSGRENPGRGPGNPGNPANGHFDSHHHR